MATEGARASEHIQPVRRRHSLAELLTFPSLAILKRETLGYMRQRRTAIWLTLLVLAGVLYVLNTWPEEGVRISMQAASPQGQNESRTVFFGTGQVFLLGCMVLLPPVAAGAIASERQKDTLAQLSVTLIRPTSLLLAKAANTLGFFAMLLVTYIPIFGTLFFLPGVDTVEFMFVLAVVFATALGCAGLGILASSLVSNTTAATVIAYIGIVIFQSSPYGVVAGLKRSGASEMGVAVFVLVVYEVFLFVVSLLIARAMLRFFVHKPVRVRQERVIDDPALLRMRRSTYPFYLVDPLRRKKPLGDHINPIFVREIFWGLTRNLTNLIRVTYISLCVFVLGAAIAGTFRGWYWDIHAWMTFEIGVVLMLIPPFVASAFAKEQEVGNLDMLRMTLVPPRQIIIGKTLGTAASVLCVCTAALASCLILLWVDPASLSDAWHGFISLLVSAFYALSLTMLISVLCKRTVTAILVAYGVLAVAFYGLPALMDQFFERFVFPRGILPHFHPSVFALLSPWTTYASDELGEATQFLWALNCIVFAGISLLLLFAATSFFRRRRLQDV
ncbi:MAG: ABC transporter permease [Candidatus Hydrogenedentota bacterium]